MKESERAWKTTEKKKKKNSNSDPKTQKMTLFSRLPLLLLLLALAAQQQQRATCSSFNASQSHHPRGRVLALLPHPSQRFSRFSHLFSAIEARGYEVVARSADDPALRLREWDRWLWDKVVVIPEEKGERRVEVERRKEKQKRRRETGHDRFQQSNAPLERNLDLHLDLLVSPVLPSCSPRANVSLPLAALSQNLTPLKILLYKTNT